MEHFICIEVKYKGKAPKYIGEFNFDITGYDISFSVDYKNLYRK